MADTDIEWTHRPGTKGVTWNPATGCDRISAGCDLCYALTMAKRLKAMGSGKYQNDGDPRTSGPGFGLTVHPDTLDEPLRWRAPRTVFVNSMSDLFHARVPREFLAATFATMARTPQHTYQVLTKRPERMARVLDEPAFRNLAAMGACAAPDRLRLRVPRDERGQVAWPLSNVWLGTSIESDKHTGRADHLRATPAAVRFISAEPLLGPLPSLDLTGIDWLIVGGESGPGARPMALDWVYDLIRLAREAGTAVFVKQLGRVWSQDNGGSLKGGDWNIWPDDLRLREYPEVLHG